MTQRLIDILKDNRVIASVKDEAGLRKALASRCGLVFVLFGNLCNIAGIVARIHKAGKVALVHCDLVDGLAGKEIIVDFLKDVAKADGLISSRAPILRAARDKGLYTVHRFFLIDSLSFNSLPKQYAASRADLIEIMPGCVAPKILKWVRDMMRQPVIASGMICESEDAVTALEAGAVAISTTSPSIWTELSDYRN